MLFIRTPSLPFWHRRLTPVLLQTETAECGLACLAMVASHFGHHTDLPTMRRRFNVSLKGATLKSLIGMAQAMGFQSRPLKLRLEDLHQLQRPCVLHWDMNHFVVLESIHRGRVVIHDPSVGRRTLLLAEVSEHFTGVALELLPGPNFVHAQKRPSIPLRALVGQVTGLRRSLAQLLVLGIALQACALVAPFYLQWVVDEALVANDRELITVLGLGFVLLVLIQAGIGAVRNWATTVMATSLNFQWFGTVFSHLMRLPLPFFERRHLGDIVSRFGSIQTIQQALTTKIVESFIDVLLVAGTLVMMLLYSPGLTAVTAAAAGLYGLLRMALFRTLREATAEQIQHAAKQQTHFLESARGIQSVRLFDRAEERRVGWMNILADQFNAELRIARVSLSHQTVQSALFGIERVVVIWLAALAATDGRFSVGMLFAFLAYKDQFSTRLATLIDRLLELRMLRLHADRVADIVLTSPEAHDAQAEISPDRIDASIEIRNLSFRYADGEPWILRDVSFTIPAGQAVAITGVSGCGKTTLVKVLLGLMEPTEGEVRIGNERLSALGKSNYRQIIGSVMQDDHLFAGSISDNISFFDPNAHQERVEAVARQAAIHDEIMAMPMGYGTRIGDTGGGISGGQRQRILLARAMYREPKILFLDEATSNLDVANEHLITTCFRRLQATRVIVTHRPETFESVDRVIVLEGGRIKRILTRAAPPGPQPESVNELRTA